MVGGGAGQPRWSCGGSAWPRKWQNSAIVVAVARAVTGAKIGRRERGKCMGLGRELSEDLS